MERQGQHIVNFTDDKGKAKVLSFTNRSKADHAIERLAAKGIKTERKFRPKG